MSGRVDCRTAVESWTRRPGKNSHERLRIVLNTAACIEPRRAGACLETPCLDRSSGSIITRDRGGSSSLLLIWSDRMQEHHVVVAYARVRLRQWLMNSYANSNKNGISNADDKN